MKPHVLLFVLLLGSALVQGQVINDTMRIPNKERGLNAAQQRWLKEIGIKMKSLPAERYTIVSFTKHNRQLAYSRGYHAYYYLIDSCDIPKYSLMFVYGTNVSKEMMIVRQTTTEEKQGTNCGVPRMPMLK